ncbi:MAG: monomethylamine:corrinoid methyltransferase [Chloroflexi bacterium]|nr:monomethylamine:corrinoid methyltransferase [Chloroflexota bacterium]
MISLLEVAQRTRTGPKMAEMDWNMGLFAKMQELSRRYNITVPENSWDHYYCEDDALVDRALQAGIDFVVEMGTYCIQTQRVVRFTEEEIREAVAASPRQVVMGEGDDARVLGQGPIDLPPMKGTGYLHGPFEDEIAIDVIKCYVQTIGCDYLEGYNFRRLDGYEIHGVPMEVAAAKRQVARLREAFRQLGRPGMAAVFYPISTADAVLTAAIDPLNGLRPTDGVLLSPLPDVKLDLDHLTAAIVHEQYGTRAKNGGGYSMAGGFCGDLAGAIIETIAKGILAWMTLRDVINGGGVGNTLSMRQKKIVVQPVLSWGSSVCSQALGKLNPLWGGRGKSTAAGIGSSSGPGSRTHLWEIAMGAIGSGVFGGDPSGNRWHIATVMNARHTPYETLFAREVAEATRRAGITEQDIPHLMNKMTPMLEAMPVQPGRDIRECYDLKNNRPLPWYQELGKAVQKELAAEFGLVFD